MTSGAIAIIGAGHMGGSFIQGLLKHGVSPSQLWVADPSQEKCTRLKQDHAIHTTCHNNEAITQSCAIVFAVKPQIFKTVLQEVAETIQRRRPLVISIVTGVTTADLHRALGKNTPIVRAMPNLAAAIGESATAFYATTTVSDAVRQEAETILQAIGTAIPVQDETLLDVVTAISGSGPAYFFYLMECLTIAAKQMGLSQDVAHKLVAQTALGAALLVSSKSLSPQTLREQVTSKGGTTEAAIASLKQDRLENIIQKACLAAKERAEALAKS